MTPSFGYVPCADTGRTGTGKWQRTSTVAVWRERSRPLRRVAAHAPIVARQARRRLAAQAIELELHAVSLCNDEIEILAHLGEFCVHAVVHFFRDYWSTYRGQLQAQLVPLRAHAVVFGTSRSVRGHIQRPSFRFLLQQELEAVPLPHHTVVLGAGDERSPLGRRVCGHGATATSAFAGNVVTGSGVGGFVPTITVVGFRSHASPTMAPRLGASMTPTVPQVKSA
jgi:hypothetical protein